MQSLILYVCKNHTSSLGGKRSVTNTLLVCSADFFQLLSGSCAQDLQQRILIRADALHTHTSAHMNPGMYREIHKYTHSGAPAQYVQRETLTYHHGLLQALSLVMQRRRQQIQQERLQISSQSFLQTSCQVLEQSQIKHWCSHMS